MTAHMNSHKVFVRHPLAHAIRRVLRPAHLSRVACGVLGAGLLGLTASGTVWADFPAAIDLSTLDGSNGFALNGINAGDWSGRSVSGAGDINGDGIEDLIIGAPAALNGAGQSYVVFGGPGVGRGGALELSALNGSNGFALNGAFPGDFSSSSVSDAGDINGDGTDDLIIGAYQAHPNGQQNAGQSYVVFGGPGVGAGGVLELSVLNGSNGFALNGIVLGLSGRSVSGAGDVNDDGVDDLIIGAPGYMVQYGAAGHSYVVFGEPGVGTGGVLELSALNGTNGFAVIGINEADYSGISVSRAGDVNGDGVDDLIIGARGAAPNGKERAGQSYVVFGGAGVGNGGVLELAALDGSNGYTLNGINAYDFSGLSVSGASDINGDGVDDLIIGARAADPNGKEYAGQSYVVFGGRGVGTGGVLELSALNGTNGFAVNGINEGDVSGFSVSGASDVNGDGVDDLVIGAAVPGPNGFCSGQTYVVFGGAGVGTGGALELSALDGTNGFTLNGINAYDSSGRSVSGAGDVNGDGINDLIIGAYEADPNGRAWAGQSYVVFGGPPATASSFAALRALGDTNRDGTPEIAVIARTADGKNLSTVKDAATGSLIAQFEFSAALQPIDVTTLPAPDPSAAPGLVLLGAAPARAETRDVLTGQLRGSVAFDPTVQPLDLAVLPDQNANGVPELAMLATGSTTVEIRDARDGTWLNTLSFPAQFTPRQVLALPDLNGNGSAEVGVVLSDEGKADRVTVKDARTGALLKTLWSGADLRQAEPVADRNGNGAPEVAMLWQDPAAQTTHVWVVDAGTQQRLASLAKFRQGADSLKLVVVDDLTGNRVEDYAVLGRNPLTGDVTVTVLDGATGQWLNRISYNPDCTPLDLASIADTNGNGAADLVMLGRCGADRTLRAFVKDAKTGTLLQRLNF